MKRFEHEDVFGVELDSHSGQAVLQPGMSEACVGIRLYGAEKCLDPDVPVLAAEIGKCVTCETCQVRLENQAFTDELTGIGNRYALKQHLSTLLQQDAPILLVFTDLRNFKAVNENVSYKTGDKFLVETAKKIKELSRDGDRIAKGRAGGDEMILLMPLTKRLEEDDDFDTVPMSLDEVPAIEAEVAHRLIEGFEDIDKINRYNDSFGLRNGERLSIRVGTAVVDPVMLRKLGRSIKLSELMEMADPKTNKFVWNELG